MKTKILFYIIVPLVILAVMIPLTLSCEVSGKYYCSESEIPDNIPPIDNNAFNSVDAVYWNYYLRYKKGNYFFEDTVKVYGWLGETHHHNEMYPTKNDAKKNTKHIYLLLKGASEDISQKILLIDISKKVFAKGIITARSSPCINILWMILMITDVNDIYTE